MGYLQGLDNYINKAYSISIFDQAVTSGKLYQLYLHNHLNINAGIIKSYRYDIKVSYKGTNEEILPKINIKFLYPENLSELVCKNLKSDKKISALRLETILFPKDRYHIKNKTLFPLMKERRVIFFTLLEGEIIRGIITGFSRYEITVNLKGGVPVTILRHSIYDVRDKKGRCFLKSFQETHRDWEKSDLFVKEPKDK